MTRTRSKAKRANLVARLLALAATLLKRTGDLSNWPSAVAALQERYPGVRIVVPGHVDMGGSELLAHTRELLGE